MAEMAKGKTELILFGAFFYMASSVFVRLAGFIIQIVLGWYLTQEEFGVYALALSISAIAACIRNGGTDQILIQRGREFNQLYPQIASFSLAFNVFIATVVIVFADTIADYFKQPDLTFLVMVLALGYLFATPGPVYIASLSVKEQFNQVSIVNLLTILLKHGLTLLLVFMGFGVKGLIIALACQPIILALIGYYYCRFPIKFWSVSKDDFLSIFRSSRWVMASNFALQFAQNIQYFILGLHFPTASLGVYFFAVQLINSPLTLLASTFTSIIFPSLSNRYSDKQVYEKAVHHSLVTIFSAGSIAAFFCYLALPWLTELIWQGKWAESLPYIQLVSLMLPAILLRNSIYEIVGSAGKWNIGFAILLIFSIVEVLIIVSLLAYDDMYLICICLLLGRSLQALVFLLIIVKQFCQAKLLPFFMKFLLVNTLVNCAFVYHYFYGGITGLQYLVALGIFYYAYILLAQPPIKMLVRKFAGKYAGGQ